VIALHPIAGAAVRMRSPIGLRMVDDFTQQPPLGELVIRIDLADGVGGYTETDLRATITPSSVIAVPGLGRQARVASQPPVQHRLRVLAELYRPLYRAVSDGIVFGVPPYSDAEPASLPLPTFGQLILLPAFHYQFPSHVPVVRGEVIDPQLQPVADALVIDQLFNERTLTDERGAFSLPLRRLAPGVPDTLAVTDRLGRAGNLSITLPGALAAGVVISVS
jgi:hypothetical protein